MPRAPQVSILVRVALLFVAVAVACAQPASLGLAQSTPPAAAAVKGLDELFNRLRAAKDEYEAGKIEQQIDELWSRSGKPEIDQLMDQAMDLLAQLKFPEALQVLDRLVQRAPDWADGWSVHANLLSLRKDPDGCIASTERALTLEPRHFHALRTMGACYMDKGQDGEALAAYRRALAIHPFLQERLDAIPQLEKKLGDKAR